MGVVDQARSLLGCDRPGGNVTNVLKRLSCLVAVIAMAVAGVKGIGTWALYIKVLHIAFT